MLAAPSHDDHSASRRLDVLREEAPHLIDGDREEFTAVRITPERIRILGRGIIIDMHPREAMKLAQAIRKEI